MNLKYWASTRRSHQQNIPLWMVKDLNMNTGTTGPTKYHRRIYLDDVLPLFPEVIMNEDDWWRCNGANTINNEKNAKYVAMQNNWKGCYRLMPTGGGLKGFGKYRKCRFSPTKESPYCHYHYDLALKDGRIKSSNYSLMQHLILFWNRLKNSSTKKAKTT